MTGSEGRSIAILPPLSAEEARHSEAVRSLLRRAVSSAGGWLSFERFMELALYAPGLGYYSAGSVKLGASGDFVTAPEVSPLFGGCVARQCREVLAVTGGEILELGAGTGRMAAQVLTQLAAEGALPERYAILEVSADLAERQRGELARLPAAARERVVWLGELPRTPLRGVILANEVADALPCCRFIVTAQGVDALGVALAGEEFRDQAAPADAQMLRAWAQLQGSLAEALPEGYQSELCLRVTPWIASLAECLERGLLLLSDYGLPRRHYYHPQRTRGTLRCHFRQRAHGDPYINPGLQDITAWVDFTRVAEAAAGAGLEVAGFATQAAFLLATGIEGLIASEAEGAAQTRRTGEARRLVMPEEMGEAFKFMALTRGYGAALSGFALQDLRHQL